MELVGLCAYLYTSQTPWRVQGGWGAQGAWAAPWIPALSLYMPDQTFMLDRSGRTAFTGVFSKVGWGNFGNGAALGISNSAYINWADAHSGSVRKAQKDKALYSLTSAWVLDKTSSCTIHSHTHTDTLTHKLTVCSQSPPLWRWSAKGTQWPHMWRFGCHQYLYFGLYLSYGHGVVQGSSQEFFLKCFMSRGQYWVVNTLVGFSINKQCLYIIIQSYKLHCLVSWYIHAITAWQGFIVAFEQKLALHLYPCN